MTTAVETRSKRKLTPPEVAALWGVSPDKVTAWIHSGELRAIDASTRAGERPRFLIDVADLEDFERRRAVQPAPPTKRRRRKQADVEEFY
jgi:excisionase family DNA binding protein